MTDDTEIIDRIKSAKYYNERLKLHANREDNPFLEDITGFNTAILVELARINSSIHKIGDIGSIQERLDVLTSIILGSELTRTPSLVLDVGSLQKQVKIVIGLLVALVVTVAIMCFVVWRLSRGLAA